MKQQTLMLYAIFRAGGRAKTTTICNFVGTNLFWVHNNGRHLKSRSLVVEIPCESHKRRSDRCSIWEISPKRAEHARKLVKEEFGEEFGGDCDIPND